MSLYADHARSMQASDPANIQREDTVTTTTSPSPDRSPYDTLIDEILSKVPERTGSPGWGRLEILGHRAFVGFVSEREFLGDRQAVIEVLDPSGGLREAGLYSKASFFAFTPMAVRDVARATPWVQDKINDVMYEARRALPPAPPPIEPDDALDEDEPVSLGAQMITDSRTRQISQGGYDAAHDDKHTEGELLQAALHYVNPAQHHWPFEDGKPAPDGDRVSALAEAGALLAAEIDRLLRADSEPSDSDMY